MKQGAFKKLAGSHLIQGAAALTLGGVLGFRLTQNLVDSADHEVSGLQLKRMRNDVKIVGLMKKTKELIERAENQRRHGAVEKCINRSIAKGNADLKNSKACLETNPIFLQHPNKVITLDHDQVEPTCLLPMQEIGMEILQATKDCIEMEASGDTI